MGYSPFVILFACFGLISVQAADPAPCSTPACKQAAAYISGAMNATVSPCDDFYEYACGGWKAHHTIPEWKSRFGTFDSMNDLMTGEIRDLLAKINLADLKSSNVSNAVAFGAYTYQKCLELGKASNETGLAELKEVIHSIFGDVFGGSGKEPVYGDWNVNYVKTYLAGVNSIFSLYVAPDPKNVKVNIINLDPASFGLGDKELQNLTENAKDVTAYKDYMRRSAKLFCGDKCPTTLDQDIDDIVQLESQLALNKLAVEDQRDPTVTYNLFTFKQLHEKSKFDWLNDLVVNIVKSVGFAPVVNDNTTLIVSDVNYTIKAIEILAKTPKKTLQNYALWRVVSSYGPKSSEQFRDNVFQFNKVISGVQKLADRNETCESVANALDMALSRLFVDNYFTSGEKQAAVELIDSIQASYEELIKQNSWLDEETRKKSLSKLQHVTKNVAYPTWLLQNDQLDQFYLLQNQTEVLNLLADKNYLHSLAKFETLQVKKSVIALARPVVVDKNWPMPPAIINAAYEPEQNSITIPAGILKSPFFDSARPFSINYGFIGVVIGHEFTHGLDDEGRQYDEQGNFQNWWTPEAIKRFHNRSECFVQQYGSKVDKTTGLHLNGRNTLGENIADNGGLHESFNAFQTRQAKTPSPTLADLPKFNPEQLFFISFANTWCQLVRPQKLKLQIEYDPHSPGQFRVNVPLSNSDHFAKAFNCPAGSPMNPKDKCLLW